MRGVVMVAGVVVRGGGDDDEWLYEMHSVASKNPFKGIDEAMRCLMEGSRDEAVTLLSKCAVAATDTPHADGMDGRSLGQQPPLASPRSTQHQHRQVQRAYTYVKRQADGESEWDIDGSWCATVDSDGS